MGLKFDNMYGDGYQPPAPVFVRCKDCRHWRGYFQTQGTCSLIDRLSANKGATLVVINDPGPPYPVLHTHADFGCVLGEAKS